MGAVCENVRCPITLEQTGSEGASAKNHILTFMNRPTDSPLKMCLMKWLWWMWWTVKITTTCPCWDVLSSVSLSLRSTAGLWHSIANASFWMPTLWWVHWHMPICLKLVEGRITNTRGGSSFPCVLVVKAHLSQSPSQHRGNGVSQISSFSIEKEFVTITIKTRTTHLPTYLQYVPTEWN